MMFPDIARQISATNQGLLEVLVVVLCGVVVRDLDYHPTLGNYRQSGDEF